MSTGFVIFILYVAVCVCPSSVYVIVKFFVTSLLLLYSESAGLMFTLEPEVVSVIIAVVIVGVDVVPLAYVTVIIPPFTVNASP